MKMLKIVAVSVITFVISSSFAVADSSLYQAIGKHNSELAKAIMGEDIQRLGDSHTYTDDAFVYAPSTPTVYGKEEIRQFWEGVITAGAKHVSLDIHHVHQSGDLAYAVGNLKFVDKAGQASDSRYLLVFKREGEQWKLHLDMWTPSVASK